MFSKLLTWAISAAQTTAKAQALKQMQLLSTQLIEHINKAAPDVADSAAKHLEAAISTAVAGTLSRRD